MKTNIKALELIEKGLSSRTVGKLTESQIDVLHSKLVNEQVTEVPSKKSYKVGPNGGEVGGMIIKQDPNTKEVMVTAKEGEMEEDTTINVSKDPDATDDGMGIFETGKSQKQNPYAICHAQVGPNKETRKFKRCVQSVKKQLGEGKNVVSLFLENEIMKIVERNLPPRITKGELVKYLTEADTETAPTRTKPTTKPGTRPSHPGKNPNPGVNPAPKADDTTTAPTRTKPTTKPGIRPSHPGKNPNPGVNPAPKANRPSPEEAKDKIMDVIIQILDK